MTFRDWLREVWLEHIEEVITWTGSTPTYTSEGYFSKYKWWLRREYQHRFKKVK
jgi:hypothetical protein